MSSRDVARSCLGRATFHLWKAIDELTTAHRCLQDTDARLAEDVYQTAKAIELLAASSTGEVMSVALLLVGLDGES